MRFNLVVEQVCINFLIFLFSEIKKILFFRLEWFINGWCWVYQHYIMLRDKNTPGNRFIWSFTRLGDLESAYKILLQMVSIATRGNIPIARTVHGKVYTNRLDIPVPSNKGPGSTMLDLKENKKLGYCIHPALMYIPDSISASIEQQIICMGNKKAKSTELAGLNGQKHPLLKKALSRSFDDIIHGCAKQKNHMLARKLMLQVYIWLTLYMFFNAPCNTAHVVM